MARQRPPEKRPGAKHAGAPAAPAPETTALSPAAMLLARHPNLIIAGLLLLATAVFYWPVLSGKGFLWNDFIEQNFPYRLFAAVSLKQGVFPFWNPYVFSGMPFFADIQTAVLYPLNLVLTLFASETWLSPALFQIQVIAHIFMTGFFTFLLARDFRISRAGSLLAGLTFMFSGFFTAHVFHVNVLHVAAWFPLIVLLFKRTIEKISLVYMAASAAVMTIVILAGYPQLLMHMYYWLGAWFLYTLAVRVREGTGVKPEVARAALFAGLVVLSVGLSAVQLLPTAELAEHSARPTMAFEESSEGSFRPYRFITLLAPGFFGKPDQTYWGISTRDFNAGAHYYWETAIYAGIVSLVLTGLALAFVRSPQVIFFGSIGLMSLLLAMGDSFFMYGLFYKLLPGFNRFRVPARFAYMFGFSVALLAGFGLHWLQSYVREKKQGRRRVEIVLYAVCGVAVAFTLLFSVGAFKQAVGEFLMNSGLGGDVAQTRGFVDQVAYPGAIRSLWLFVFFVASSVGIVLLRINGRLSSRAAALSCIAVLMVDFLAFGHGYAAQKQDPARVFARDNLVSQFQELSGKEYFRINSRSSKPGTDDLGGRQMLFHKNQGSVHRLFLMEGYNPLRLKRQLVNRKSRTLDILNVKYRIDVDERTGQSSIVAHQSYFPRAWMAYRYRIEAHEDSILPLLYSERFDHRNELVLEEQPLSVNQLDSGITPVWDARITKYTLNRIELEIETERAGFLALSEIHYPAWKAQVDGKDAPLFRANYALRAIAVPAGKHTVVCSYRDESFARGSLISGVSLAVLLMCAGAGVALSRRKNV